MQHEISLATAIAMTERYRKDHPDNFPLSESFELASIQRLITTPGAAFLRIYYGLKEDGQMDAILVVADKENRDILPAKTASLSPSNDGPVILEDGFRCPPACPPPSPLNK